MRFILIVLFLIIYFIFSIPMWLIGFLIGLTDKDAKHRFAQPFVNFGFRGILFIGGVKVIVKGKENQPDRPALYTFNHRGFFDIIIGYVTSPPLTLFVAKKELEHIPLISRWMRYMHCLFLDREDPRKGLETINQGVELLKSGHNVYVAPEGTRNDTDDMLEFHEATFRLAIKSKSPIVPVAINNTAAVFEDHLPWVKSHTVCIEYLEPIYLDDMSRADQKHIGATVRDIIQKKVYENQSLVK
ncbi:MAG: 1-acyl-sn-glycerol-3-phosphate acyltransferase [Lachnospiraceae bacterium]|nr:1-acyl-sn-glycerol-3-phosphate acyltransferase [Lachnospiraceae bacterium]